MVGLPHPENPNCPLTARGFSNLSTGISYPGHSMFGGNAQFVARPEHYWLPLPEVVAPETAAAAMWSYSTAHRIVHERLALQRGDTVLITGITGGMGSATLDLARLAGARVIGITRSAEKAEFLRRRGVEHPIVAADAAAAPAIKDLTGGLGVDAAVEFTGNPKLARLCIDAMRPGGTLVTSGADWSGERFPVVDQDFVRLELTIRGIRGSQLADQRAVLDLLARKAIQPAIFAVMPLSTIARAHSLLENATITGRIVLDPWTEA